MYKISLKNLFMTFFKINAVTFGGGYTIVTVVRDEFVDKLQILSEDEMMDILALAQGGPGAMAISTSILTGYKLRGPLGAITCLVASTLPCLIILSLVSIFYNQVKDNFYVRAAFDGISGVICAALFLTVFNMGKNSYKKYPGFTLAMLVLVFILGFFLKIKTAYLIIMCAAIGIAVFSYLDWRLKNV